MVLDENCIETLASRMQKGVGIVVGYLRDPLQGRIEGVKLFRTECCRSYPLKDVPSVETTFLADLETNGWEVRFLTQEESHSLGTHRTDMSDPVYFFERFKNLGGKIFVRRGWTDLMRRLFNLRKSK